MRIEVYAEICCELCNEIIHNHLDCPICESKNEDSENFGELGKDDILECTNCGAKFKLIKGSWYGKDNDCIHINNMRKILTKI